jgi:hypothetical protein
MIYSISIHKLGKNVFGYMLLSSSLLISNILKEISEIFEILFSSSLVNETTLIFLALARLTLSNTTFVSPDLETTIRASISSMLFSKIPIESLPVEKIHFFS